MRNADLKGGITKLRTLSEILGIRMTVRGIISYISTNATSLNRLSKVFKFM